MAKKKKNPITKAEKDEAAKRLTRAQKEIFSAKDKWISKLLSVVTDLMKDKPKDEWPKKIRDAYDFDEITDEELVSDGV